MYASEFVAWMAVVMLLIVIAWMAKDRKDMRAELKKFWDAEDIRRGYYDRYYPDKSSSCDECNVDTPYGCHLCKDCQRSILQSGDH